MGTVVDLRVPTDQFALAETLGACPDATVESVRLAAHGPGEVMPYIWVADPRPDRVEARLRRDSSTDDVRRLSSDGDDRELYGVDWADGVCDVCEMFLRADGSVLGAQGTSDCWQFRLLFPDRAAVSAAYATWRGRGLDASIERVNGVSHRLDHSGADLSACQRETLLTALETDYYEVPRAITLDGLADELDVSHQALSERLRRGHRNIIETTLQRQPTRVTQHP